MLSTDKIKELSPNEVEQAYKNGELDQFVDLRLTSLQMLHIKGSILILMAQKGILHTEPICN